MFPLQKNSKKLLTNEINFKKMKIVLEKKLQNFSHNLVRRIVPKKKQKVVSHA